MTSTFISFDSDALSASGTFARSASSFLLSVILAELILEYNFRQDARLIVSCFPSRFDTKPRAESQASVDFWADISRPGENKIATGRTRRGTSSAVRWVSCSISRWNTTFLWTVENSICRTVEDDLRVSLPQLCFFVSKTLLCLSKSMSKSSAAFQCRVLSEHTEHGDRPSSHWRT